MNTLCDNYLASFFECGMFSYFHKFVALLMSMDNILITNYKCILQCISMQFHLQTSRWTVLTKAKWKMA